MRPVNILSILILLILLSFGQTTARQEPLTNVLTLVLTIGGEDDKNAPEYLLAKPGDIAVTKSGDILISDEKRIKIFDSSGNGKAVCGGAGDGPGEFSMSRQVFIRISGERGVFPIIINLSPKGFITAFESSFSIGSADYYNIYTPEYKNYDRKLITGNSRVTAYLNDHGYDTRRTGIQNAVFLNENFTLFHLNLNNSFEEILGYDDGKEFYVIQHYVKPGVFARGSGYSTITTDAQLRFVLLPNSDIVFCHGYYDSSLDEPEETVSLHIVCLDPYNEQTVQLPNIPVALTEQELEEKKEQLESMKSRRNTVFDNETEKLLDDFFGKPYKPAFNKLMIDGNILFINTFLKNEKDEYYTAVYNTETWEKISDFYTPEWFSGFKTDPFQTEKVVISDGYVYRLSSKTDEFPEVQKYRIDPKVYKK
ncbi:hypothetical protein ACFL5P_03255 [candidate division KSB1 bacterium]